VNRMTAFARERIENSVTEHLFDLTVCGFQTGSPRYRHNCAI